MPTLQDSTASAATGTLIYAITGKPNCGKSTIFNALTGLRQKVGNYAGATVECKIGQTRGLHGERVTLLDLPGTYSLAVTSPDEAVARDAMIGRCKGTPAPRRYVCVADASNLQHGLFLVSQIAELGRPVILALNMMDEARARGMKINIPLLESRLGVTVVPMEASRGVGLVELRTALARRQLPSSPVQWEIPSEVSEAIDDLAPAFEDILPPGDTADPERASRALALLWLADSARELSHLDPVLNSRVIGWRERLDASSHGWRSRLIAARHRHIASICREVVDTSETAGEHFTRKIDAVLLHPVLGWVALAAIMFAIFYSIFSLATVPMDWIDQTFSSLAAWVGETLPPGQLTDLLANGIIAGVGGVLIFLPQILLLFFFINILESSGYMPRIAFMLDRLFRVFGLDGRAFIPLLSSYACAIPGIMGARVIRSPLERMATIMVAPWMTCPARLPVFFLLISVLVPGTGAQAALGKTLLLAATYLIGSLAALGAALVLRRTLLRGAAGGFTVELPTYRWPVWRNVLFEMFERGKVFLHKAGTIILGVSIILWFLASYPHVTGPGGAEATPAEQIDGSYAGMLGHAIEPAIKPLGFDWKIGVGIVAAMAAREVFVSTMAIIYKVGEEDGGDDEGGLLRAAMQSDTWSDGSPIFTPLSVLSLMVFFIFALQCVSTIAIVRRETNSWRWPLFQFAFMTGTAYIASLAIFQIGRALGFS